VLLGAMAAAHPMCGIRAAASSSPVVAAAVVVAAVVPTVAVQAARAAPAVEFLKVARVGGEPLEAAAVLSTVEAWAGSVASVGAGQDLRVLRLDRPAASRLRPVRAWTAAPLAPALGHRAVPKTPA
jgi:hypothetical protein